MRANRTVRLLAVIACMVAMTPAVGASQIRTRNRDSRRTVLAPLPNIFTEQQSRTRLGLHLDPGQSRRFDGDGALIMGVMRDSPAEDAGLQEGDVITVFEGHVLTIPLADSDVERDFDLDQSLPAQRLLALARDLEPGQTVELRYLRDGANNTVSVEAQDFEFPRVRTFSQAPDVLWGRGWGGNWSGGWDGNAFSRFRGDHDLDIDMADRIRDLGNRLEDLTIAVPGGWSYSFGVTSVEGVEFIDLNPELGEYFGAESGVLVVDVDEESTLGLMAGDVVLAVGAREADTVSRVLRLIRSYEEDEPIRFRIIRQRSELVTEGFLE